MGRIQEFGHRIVVVGVLGGQNLGREDDSDADVVGSVVAGGVVESWRDATVVVAAETNGVRFGLGGGTAGRQIAAVRIADRRNRHCSRYAADWISVPAC